MNACRQTREEAPETATRLSVSAQERGQRLDAFLSARLGLSRSKVKRAVEEGLTVVRAANSGISALISKTGVVLSALPLNERGVLDFYLPQKLSVSTPFSRLHNLTVIILASVSIAVAALLSSKKKKTPDFS